MQHVNDDMDDVFKKAGASYPLDTGMPDWDKVQLALNLQIKPEPAAKKKNTKYLWLLCLLPIVFICTRYTGKSDNSAAYDITMVKKTSTAAKSRHAIEGSKKRHAPKPLPPITLTNAAHKTTATKKENYFKQQEKPASAKSKIHQFPAQKKEQKNVLNQVGLLDYGFEQGESAKKSPAQQRTATEVSRIDAIANQTSAGLRSHFVLDSISKAIAADAVLHPKKSAGKMPKSTLRYTKGLYAGIMGSADLTTVQLQKTANMGWQYGVLSGYAFHKKWSIEAGVFADRKYYYSKGKYLDKSRTYLPPNTDITEITGSCTMLEFPLAVKYNLPPGKRSQFFATAGLSSYVMKKEDYAYTYYYRGSGNYAIHDKSYRNASTNLFSVLQFSGGYSRSLGPSTSVRIEPYLKLPLARLGYGRLHFTSLGLSAGVVKSFRR